MLEPKLKKHCKNTPTNYNIVKIKVRIHFQCKNRHLRNDIVIEKKYIVTKFLGYESFT